MAGYKLTAGAKNDLKRSLAYLKQSFGRDVASKVRKRYSATFASLARNPDVGHLRQDLSPNQEIRLWPVGPAIIAYRYHDGVVETLAVERAARDWVEINFRLALLSVRELKTASDEVRSSVDEVRSSVDEVKSSVDELKSSVNPSCRQGY